LIISSAIETVSFIDEIEIFSGISLELWYSENGIRVNVIVGIQNGGFSNTISVPSTYAMTVGDLIIFRKSTSDGAVPINENDYDTALDGGTLEYNSATGLDPADIILDGDGFVTETTGGGPEELVNGQVVDTVAIKVFDRPSDGSASIKVLSYIADGTNKKF
jgi:hypothetical protein